MKKLITLFAMFIAFIAVANAQDNQCMTLIMDKDVVSMITGDVPDGVTYEFTSDYTANRNYLTKDQQYNMVIKGMPSDAHISKIEVAGFCHQRTGKAYIRAYVGSEEFASLKYSGTRVEGYGQKVGQTLTTMEMTMTNESVACVDDITLHALCESDNMTVKNYYIYYTISESTGISNAETSASNDAIYNLQGIRVDNPVKGNIYIKGGKKIVY